MAPPVTTSPPPQLYFSPAGEAELRRLYDAAVADLPAPHTERFVQTPTFGQVHVLECGPPDAPPLVLWQGTACPGPFMLSAGFGFRALTERFRVIVPDVPLQCECDVGWRGHLPLSEGRRLVCGPGNYWSVHACMSRTPPHILAHCTHPLLPSCCIRLVQPAAAATQ